jgi:glycosyltransferase involved in cell wall biosynthesis
MQKKNHAMPAASPIAQESRVSAIIPNYNHGRVIGAAVAALQVQTVAPWEIIVVDDGSTDDSREVIAALCAADPRIRSIAHPHNLGAIAALNTGIAAATGNLVYLGAADDVAHPQLIATLVAAFSRSPGLGLCCGEIRLVDAASGTVALRPAIRPSLSAAAFSPAQTRSLLIRIDNFIMTGAALIDRRKLLSIGGLRPELGSFADGFAVRQMALLHGFGFVPEILADWRVSAAGLSRQTASDPGAVERLLVKVRLAFAESPAFPSDYADRFERRWRFGVLRLALDNPSEAQPLFSAVAPGSLSVRRLLYQVAKLPVVGRPLVLALLTLALRPFSLSALLSTALARAKMPAPQS